MKRGQVKQAWRDGKRVRTRLPTRAMAWRSSRSCEPCDTARNPVSPAPEALQPPRLGRLVDGAHDGRVKRLPLLESLVERDAAQLAAHGRLRQLRHSVQGAVHPVGRLERVHDAHCEWSGWRGGGGMGRQVRGAGEGSGPAVECRRRAKALLSRPPLCDSIQPTIQNTVDADGHVVLAT